MGRENESLFTGSWSHDPDGRHAHTGKNHSKKNFSRTDKPIFTKLGM